MRSTPEEIRRRIAKRKRSSGSPRKESERLITWPGDEEKYGFNHSRPTKQNLMTREIIPYLKKKYLSSKS